MARKATSKAGKSKTGYKAEYPLPPTKRKAKVVDYAAALKAAEVKTGQERITHRDILDKWYLYTAVEFRQGDKGEFSLCKVVEVSSDGKKIVGQPVQVLVGAQACLDRLHVWTVPFVAKIQKSSRPGRYGKYFYFFV